MFRQLKIGDVAYKVNLSDYEVSVVKVEDAKLLYTQALLMEGMLPTDPKEFSDSLCELMINSVK